MTRQGLWTLLSVHLCLGSWGALALIVLAPRLQATQDSLSGAAMLAMVVAPVAVSILLAWLMDGGSGGSGGGSWSGSDGGAGPGGCAAGGGCAGCGGCGGGL
ncbi:hypothetical protein OHU17_35705 (plasmid) [Streptomyces goshikiensis]|uniref:Uncharacterized protein n=1 Tax=Streptomyces goshikiensis TaxID=1942 RepID=A0ABZ1RX93_9ACTN|nr:MULTISPECIES: hypothetical protein [Streptomyces]MBP0932118.1 hypothetical protein [Streptomyces sp. KCTC 0041BP]